MILIYKTTFITGVLYAVISVILGQLLDFTDIEIDGDMDISLFTILPIKPITVVTFITVFGGVGMICTLKEMKSLYTFLTSFMLAYLTSYLVYRLIVIPLKNAQNTSAPSQRELIGLDAEVKASIMENGFGEISYMKNGNTYNGPAKHIGGGFIKSGTKVFILEIKDNVFYVERKNFFY